MSENTGDLTSYSFYRDLVERVIRQVLQVLGPVLAVVAATGQGFEVKPVALAVALAAALTVLKAVAGIKVPDGTSELAVLLDRAGSAASAVVIGLLPSDGLGLLSLNWTNVGIAAAGAAALAVVSYYGAPPSQAESVYDLAA